jgi:hypothetical protein
MGVLRKLETVCWGQPSEDPKERKLLRKLDSVILTYVCLSCECHHSLTTQAPVGSPRWAHPGENLDPR